MVTFNGVKYRRYPDSPHESCRRYFIAGKADRMRGFDYLHRAVYRHHHGAIPDGFHVHHVDGDPLNNDLANLRAVDAREHADLHWTPERRATQRAQADRVRHLAAAWHSSPEGIEWHREHAARSILAAVATEHVCEQCAATYETVPRSGRAAPRFCSNACKSAWRRGSGVDDEERACGHCGGAFTVNRYSKKQQCSRLCGQAARRAARSGVRADGARVA